MEAEVQLDWRVRIGIVAAGAAVIVAALVISIWSPAVLDTVNHWIDLGLGILGGAGFGVAIAGGPSPEVPK